MHISLADESRFGLHTLRASNGLCISFLPSGCLYAIECNGILINQVLGSPVAGGIHRIYLRARDNVEMSWQEIVGPRAVSAFDCSKYRADCTWSRRGLNYRCTCRLHPSGAGWFFHVEVENRSKKAVRCDAILVQDLGLA